VDVVVDRNHLDPARVRLRAKFVPYDIEGTARKREDRGRFTHLRYDYVLRCLRVSCIGEVLPSAAGEAESGRAERRILNLEPARVLYAEAEGPPRLLTRARWPELASVSRIKPSDVPPRGFVFKKNVTPLPAADYRVSPTLLGAGLLVGSVALLALPIGVAVRWARQRRPPEPVEEEIELPPLERALALVEWAREREEPGELRQALEVLAVELEVDEMPHLANAARALAWSQPEPPREDVTRLVEAVRRADERP
jgi:hypothetical protein